VFCVSVFLVTDSVHELVTCL